MAYTFEKYTVDDNDAMIIGHSAADASLTVAQTFTIGTTGNDLTFTISSVGLKILEQGTAVNDLTVAVYPVRPDGLPDTSGTALSTGTITKGTLSSTATWVNVTMSAGTLQATTQYALVLSSSGGSGGNEYRWNIDAVGAAYAGGGAYQWFSTDSDYTAVATSDFMFTINGGDYEGTLCTLADATNKAGVNASSAATNESLVSDWVKQAEGQILATSRYDWVDKYSSLSSDVKYLLNRIASSMAAIDIINYDLVPSGGAQDRVTSETMINVHRETVALGLSLLRDKQVTTFITGDS